jgi:hypothetical protein
MRDEETPRTLRLMTAPAGRWPAPVLIDGPPVILQYLDFQDRERRWRCTLTRARQGDATVMIEVLREQESYAIPLKMHRITGITEGATHWPGYTYVTEALGIKAEWARGPRG